MICERCGWDGAETPSPAEMKLVNWPEGVPLPPVLPSYQQHPENCVSRLKIGDEVYWNCGGAGPDIPPVRGWFEKLIEFVGPDFVLTDGQWVQTAKAVPYLAIIRLDIESIGDCHLRVVDTLREKTEPNDEITVAFDDLELVAKWPILL